MAKTGRRTAGILCTVAAALAALLPAAGATAEEPAARSAQRPEVLPTLRDWTPATGRFQLAERPRIVLESADRRTTADARRFVRELAGQTGTRPELSTGKARPGDVLLRQRPGRKSLGAEGYQLESGQRLTVTGATPAGVFYGTRTVLQLLKGDRRAEAGKATDVPSYRERGAGVCACYVHVSMDWFERLMRDMASQKLNQLWIEAKVKSTADPGSAFWGYYTKAEVRQLAAMAERFHITLVPEINSPGHMDPYLENHPELQIKNKDGEPSSSRLDITRPESLRHYTALVDEALREWGTDEWHMGADEYMLGSDYADYPQLQEYAREKFGGKATPDDAFVDFVNQVNAHVRKGGRTLRVWNDGLLGRNRTVPLDRNITVEHWLGGEQLQQPSSLLAEGRPVMNSAYALYLVRGGFTPDTKKLYDSGWTPLSFEGETLSGRPDKLTGAKISLWPDNGAAETENEVEAKTFLPLRFLAQATWGGPKPAATYEGFSELAHRLGHAPGWRNTDRRPVPDGTHALTAAGGKRLAPVSAAPGSEVALRAADGAAWELKATDDGYYTVRSAVPGSPGLCLATERGKRYLGAPLEAGAVLTVEACAAGTRTQRWQADARPGSRLVLRNAVSQLQLSERASDGTAVQTAPDTTAPAVFRATPARD